MAAFGTKSYIWLAQFCASELARTSSECERLEVISFIYRLVAALSQSNANFDEQRFLLTAMAGANQ